MAQISATDTVYAAADFRVGSLFGRSFGVFGRHFILFLAVSALPALPSLLVAGGTRNPSQLGAGGLLLALGGLLVPITQAVVLYGTFQDMRAKSFGFTEAVSRGLARFFPIIGLGFCEGLAVMLGLVLLVVPGFILLAMFFVALPACVVEKTGPIDSLKRSAALTKGHKWKVFGIVLMLALANMAGSAVLQWFFTPLDLAMAAAISGVIWNGLITAFGSILVAVVYHDLRTAKEGIDIDRMAAVFD